MRSTRVIHTVSAHAGGEVGDVIVGGVAPPPGKTLWEQSRWIAHDTTLRNFMLNEPRGGVFRHVNLLVPPVDPRANAAWIIMEPEDTPPMSGSNAICVATVLVETGLVPVTEPQTVLMLEAPGGLVTATVNVVDGRAVQVHITNVASFAQALATPLEVASLGTLTVDTAYGGDSFVLVDGPALGFSLTPDEARDLAEMGMRITAAATEQIGFSHPENPDWRHISFCQWQGPVERVEGGLRGRNACAIRPGKIDRSPTGTGCSARMAVMTARGEMGVGDVFIGQSLIGSEFRCEINALTEVAGKPAIIPRISGRAWITGTHQHMLDPEDPYPAGYRLSDTWPDKGSGA